MDNKSQLTLRHLTGFNELYQAFSLKPYLKAIFCVMFSKLSVPTSGNIIVRPFICNQYQVGPSADTYFPHKRKPTSLCGCQVFSFWAMPSALAMPMRQALLRKGKN